MTTTKTRSDYQSTDPSAKTPSMNTPEHEERLLDQAIAESFPASDPISPAYEAGLEPVLLEDQRAREVWKRRLRKATPSLIAIGSIAVISLAVAYLLRDHRPSLRDVRASWRDLRDHLPWH